MSEVQNNLGEKFKETITEAMKTGDFHALNTLVTDTVNDALREAKNSRRSAAGRTKNGTGSAESGKSSGKNNGRLRQSRTVHGIRHSR